MSEEISGVNQRVELESVNVENLENALHVRYVKVSDLVLWDKNPKKHDIDAIISSIKEYGFRDPPAWDYTLQALIEGNGRAESLYRMMNEGDDLPKGVAVDKQSGVWCVPILFGIDSDSLSQAERYAIDHNNLTMLGGDFNVFEISQMWDHDKYSKIMQSFLDEGDLPVSLDLDDARLFIDNFDLDFDSLDDATEESDNQEEDIVDGDHYPQITIVIRNYNIVQEALESVQELLNINSEWDASIKNEL